MRTGLRAIGLAVLAFASAAVAQQISSFSLGERAAGQSHPVSLVARNADCRQPLDLRFEFAPSPWLKPQGATIARGVLPGQDQRIPAIADLSQLGPGHYTATVDVVCMNCGFILFRNCHVDRKHLIIGVDAVAPQIATRLPAPTRTPNRRVATTTPTTAPTPTAAPPETTTSIETTTPPSEPQTASTETSVAPADAAPSGDLVAMCGGPLQFWITIGAGAAAVAATAFGISQAQAASRMHLPTSPSSRIRLASKMHEALRDSAEANAGDDALDKLFDKAKDKALDKRIDACKERSERLRASLSGLAQSQLQAMRALSALGLADARQRGVAAQAAGWNKITDGVKHLLSKADVAPMSQAMGQGAGAHQNNQGQFNNLESGNNGSRMAWLKQHGFARDDAAAQAVLAEMASYQAHGPGMSDMTTRLQRAAEACRRSDAEVRLLEALGEAN